MFLLLFIPERDLSLFERDGLQNFGGEFFWLKKAFLFLPCSILYYRSHRMQSGENERETSHLVLPVSPLCYSWYTSSLSLSLSLCRFVGTGRCRLGSLQIDDFGRSAICCRHEFCASVRTCAFLFDIFLPFLFTAATIAAPIAVEWRRWATLSDGGTVKVLPNEMEQAIRSLRTHVRTCVSH